MYEMAFFSRATSKGKDPQCLKQYKNDKEDYEFINQGELQKLYKEINMFQDIEENKDTIKYCIKGEEAIG